MSVSNVSKDVLELLYSRFPKTFFQYQGRRVPLKIGIRQDLEFVLGDEIDQDLLHRALKRYCVNIPYLKSQKAGVERIDLDGNPAGVVTDKEQQHAERAVASLKAKTSCARRKPAVAKPVAPKRDGLSALKEAARKRREAASASIGGGV